MQQFDQDKSSENTQPHWMIDSHDVNQEEADDVVLMD